MIPSYVKPFEYTIPWKSRSVHYGDHRGTQRGLGHDYRGNVSLIDYPDARRMDIRQTLRDPYEQVQVRTFNQNNSTPIFAIIDLSSSMQYVGKKRKLDIAMEIAASVAFSAYNAGDLFSLIAYNDHVDENLTTPLSYHVFQSFELIENLGKYQKRQVGSKGIVDVPFYLSQQRSMIFWISDFHMPFELIEEALNAMSGHQVIPIVLWDDGEYKQLPQFGFSTMIDPESGLNRTVFFRKELRDKFIEAFEKRRADLEDLFLKFDFQALFVDAEHSPDTFNNYFEQYMSI